MHKITQIWVGSLLPCPPEGHQASACSKNFDSFLRKDGLKSGRLRESFQSQLQQYESNMC